MAVDERYRADVAEILAHRRDNGADLWATPDKRLLKGAPWSTIECAMYLSELGMDPDEPVLRDTAELIFSTRQPDGRFRMYPKGAIYPCHTIDAVQALCHLGYSSDDRVRGTFEHLLETSHNGGGWRCAKFSYGRGPETDCANPLPTLNALDAFRLAGRLGSEPVLDQAVDFLLGHWTTRVPIGPCHYGIGTLFMQVEYPFRGYGLFRYVYVLSFFSRAREDARFHEAHAALAEKLSDGRIVVERVVPKLAGLAFCRRGEPSAAATARYQEILANLALAPRQSKSSCRNVSGPSYSP